MEESIVQSFVDEIANIDKVLDPIFKLGKDNEISISDIEKSNKKTLSTFILQMIGVLNSAKKTMRKASIATDKLQTKLISSMNCEEINTLRFEKIESTLKKFNLDGTSEINSQIVTGINELSSKIDNFKPMQPIDYSKLDFSEPLKRAVSTVPQLKKSPVAIQKHARQANDELVRSNNLIIYGAPYSESNSQLAVDAAKFYFEACGVDSYCFQMDKIVDAQFMKISEDKTTCNIRVIMSNPWVVRTLLRDAPLLKTEGANLSNCFDRNDNFSFAKTYISKDRTLAEQEKHRKLVLELKEKIKDDNSIRWIIKFGKVQAGGAYKAE